MLCSIGPSSSDGGSLQNETTEVCRSLGLSRVSQNPLVVTYTLPISLLEDSPSFYLRRLSGDIGLSHRLQHDRSRSRMILAGLGSTVEKQAEEYLLV